MTHIEAAIDIETTGLLADDHRIIEVYISLHADGKLIEELDQRIDPQRSIGAEAQKVHGISHSDLIGKPLFKTVAPAIVEILTKADLFIWHNGDEFDGPFLHQELVRVGLALPSRPAVDTMLAGLWATHNGKRPRLNELAFACGVPYDPALAHKASYDVQIMYACYDLGVAWGYFPARVESGLLLAA